MYTPPLGMVLDTYDRKVDGFLNDSHTPLLPIVSVWGHVGLCMGEALRAALSPSPHLTRVKSSKPQP